MQVITDACVFEICSEKNTRESEVVGTFKNTCTVAVHCWYIKDAFAGFCQQIFSKKCQKAFEGKLTKKLLSPSAYFSYKGGVWVNPLKKKNLRQKSFSDNFEWSSKKFLKTAICWYKIWCQTKNKRTGSCIL